MAKKLNTNNVLSLHDKTFKQKPITIDVEGESFEVLIDTKFQVSKIQQLLTEVMERNQQLIKINDIFDITYYMNFLVIKYFTNIEIAKEDDFETQIRIFKALLDLEIFDKIMENFDKGELDKINKYMKKASANIKEVENNPEIMEEIQQIFKDVESLENPEVFMEDVAEEKTE
jgi:hypothetical protein